MIRRAGDEPADGQLRRLTEREREIATPERRSHGAVMGLVRPIADHNGHIAQPLRALSTVELMARKGAVTGRQLAAAGEFHRLFRLAGLDALKAADLGRVPNAGGAGTTAGSGHEFARRRIARAIAALGGEATCLASCAWHVIGLEWSLRDWAAKATRGNVHQASGILKSPLELLERKIGA